MARLRLYRQSDYRRILPIEVTEGEGHEASWRSPFRRDFARLIHSAAFRRLQGKTQLFAGLESDFFRTRLTHSLEVAQIAKTVARKLNSEALSGYQLELDTDLVELAALAHDLGHPPFGHTGEAVLDELMRDSGGFEGNAQTLRILCRLEKKLDDPKRQINDQGPIWYRNGEDASVGLNLCSRSLAAILKYDRPIPVSRSVEADASDIEKGYYSTEASIVRRVRENVVGRRAGHFKVIECQVMDLADDIAYSTYDLEDAFKGGLLTPLDLLFPENQVIEDVARRVAKELEAAFEPADVRDVIDDLFSFFAAWVEASKTTQGEDGSDLEGWYRRKLGRSYSTAKNYASVGFYRTALTSVLVNEFVHGIGVEVDQRIPALSLVTMDPRNRARVSVLKHLTYVLLIGSGRFKLVAHRGARVVRSIFEALSDKGGDSLLPDDFRQRYRQAPAALQPRVICDFIACMTDRYAVDFYARLTSETFHTMFSPL